MKIFAKKTNLTEQIAFMGIMAAINVAFVLLTTFVPFLLFVLVLTLPLSCTLVILLCEKKYFPIYAISTAILCALVTIWNISDTLFYIIPSLITGALFGILIEKKVHYSITILLCSFLQLILSYISLPLIKLITQVDLLPTLAKIFGIYSLEFSNYVIPSCVFIISLMQEIVSYFVIRYGLKHLNYQFDDKNNLLLLNIVYIINLLLNLFFVLTFKDLSFIFFISGLFLTSFVIYEIYRLKKLVNYILIVVGFFLTFFVVALFNKYVEAPLGILLFEIYFYFISIIGFINIFLEKYFRKK